jgi:hypothetical protein
MVLGIDPMGNTVQFIFYAIAVVAFGAAVIGIALHEKLTNLVALGLLAVTIPSFWDRLAGL